jgi:hypothetical protein
MKKIYNFTENFVRDYAIAIVFSCLVLFTVSYLFEFHNGFSSDQTHWGTFGDYINGITAPIIGVIGVVLTYTILNNQNKESSQSEFKFMFEILFNSTEKQIEKISFKKGRKTYVGRDAIKMLNNHISGLIVYNLKSKGIDEAVKTAFNIALEDAGYSFPAYMKNLHNCLKIIDNHCSENHKTTYAHLIRANMNSQEMIFLLYNGVGKLDFLGFKQRIEKFSMLQDIARDTSIRDDVKSLYAAKAYKD